MNRIHLFNEERFVWPWHRSLHGPAGISRRNLIRLLPHLTELMVWDNSTEADIATGAPAPVLLLHLRDGKILAPKKLAPTPEWAKPIVAAALKLQS